MSLFSMDEKLEMPVPIYPKANAWSLIERLNKEKDITGIYISAHPLDEYRFVLEHFTTCTLSNVTSFKDVPIKIAGIVTKAEHRISKKGTGYGSFILEDYFGNFEFVLFSEDYLDFKNRLEVGQMVYIKASNQTFRDGSGGSRFKIQSVQQLASAGHTVAESLLLKMPLYSIDSDRIERLKRVIESQKGNTHLKIVLLDPVSQNYLYMMSEEYKIEVNSRILKEVKELGFEYKLN